ncbi:MAG: hypothetical protein R3F60_02925 [bacterium]
MHDLIFQNQGSLGPQKFIDFATELGLNVDRFKVDMESKEIREQVLKDRQEGSTPASRRRPRSSSTAGCTWMTRPSRPSRPTSRPSWPRPLPR